jgi:carbon storage regulator
VAGSFTDRRSALLVLSRRREESIVIDGNIRVIVLAVSGNSVRLGIEAPPEVRVQRLELLTDAELDALRPPPKPVGPMEGEGLLS